MSEQEDASTRFVTIPQIDEVFDGRTIYLSGQSFKRCTFRSCTLIIKGVDRLGIFKNCNFENCVWHLDTTISDKSVWQNFLQDIAPAIAMSLPHSS
jgi:hypothetical protein